MLTSHSIFFTFFSCRHIHLMRHDNSNYIHAWLFNYSFNFFFFLFQQVNNLLPPLPSSSATVPNVLQFAAPIFKHLASTNKRHSCATENLKFWEKLSLKGAATCLFWLFLILTTKAHTQFFDNVALLLLTQPNYYELLPTSSSLWCVQCTLAFFHSFISELGFSKFNWPMKKRFLFRKKNFESLRIASALNWNLSGPQLYKPNQSTVQFFILLKQC